MQERAGNTDYISGLGRYPGGGNGNPSWDNPMDQEPGRLQSRVVKSRIQLKRLSMQAHTITKEKLH